jgi:hypothetical protein
VSLLIAAYVSTTVIEHSRPSKNVKIFFFAIYLLTDFFTKSVRFPYIRLCFRICAATAYWVSFIKKKPNRFSEIKYVDL